MISIVRKEKGIKIEEVWFSPRKENDKKVDVISYCQTPSGFAFLNKKGRTLINDLTMTEEEIWKGIHRKCKQEIKHAEEKGIQTMIYFSDSITQEMINELHTSHAQFTKEKKLPLSSNELNYLGLWWRSGHMMISRALYEGKVIINHCYIYDENIARGILSTSHYRSDSSVNKQLVGMANRLLHYRDMMEFKKLGLKSYDWAGISDDPAIQHITEFKSKFGGVETETYYVLEAVTLKGKIALQFKKLIQKFHQ
ncbi:MAG: hypothetical protein HGA49_01200 [Eubacteriaceae bacterium]|nr:hypothetical protein [Eubacteriaceae bacterium]